MTDDLDERPCRSVCDVSIRDTLFHVHAPVEHFAYTDPH